MNSPSPDDANLAYNVLMDAYTNEVANRPRSRQADLGSAGPGPVRWTAVVAGFFAVVAIFIVLITLGVGIRLALVRPEHHLGQYAVPVAIWVGATTLIAFFAGSFLAGRLVGEARDIHGLLNGVMVWTLAIPMIWLLVASGFSVGLFTAGNVAGDALESVSNTVDAIIHDKGILDLAVKSAVAPDVKESVKTLQKDASPQHVEKMAHLVSGGLLAAFAAMLVALGSSALGGWLGCRRR